MVSSGDNDYRGKTLTMLQIRSKKLLHGPSSLRRENPEEESFSEQAQISGSPRTMRTVA